MGLFYAWTDEETSRNDGSGLVWQRQTEFVIASPAPKGVVESRRGLGMARIPNSVGCAADDHQRGSWAQGSGRLD